MNQFNEIFRENGYVNVLTFSVLTSFMQIINVYSQQIEVMRPQNLIEIDTCPFINHHDPIIKLKLMSVLSIIKSLKSDIQSPDTQHIKYLTIRDSNTCAAYVAPVFNKDYVLTLTTGMFAKNFTQDEWKAIIAHEFGHILKNDADELFFRNTFLSNFSFQMILMSTIFILKTIPELINRQPIQGIEALLALGVIMWLINKNKELSQFFIQKEVRADKFSVSVTHNHESLISALNKLKIYQTQDLHNSMIRNLGIPEEQPRAQNHTIPDFILVISDPYQAIRKNAQTLTTYTLKIMDALKGWAIVESHPQHEDRINRLNSYTY